MARHKRKGAAPKVPSATNPVAKHCRAYNLAHTHQDRVREMKRGKVKHKGRMGFESFRPFYVQQLCPGVAMSILTPGGVSSCASAGLAAWYRLRHR